MPLDNKSTTHILQSNLMTALRMAIDAQQKKERDMGHTRPSTLIVGWKENLESLKQGNLSIKYE